MIEQISLNYPNVWIKTNDSFRTADQIITLLPNRNFYTIDYQKGFCQYIDEQWKPVLVQNPAEEETGVPYVTTNDTSLALHYIKSSKVSLPVFIVHQFTDPSSNLVLQAPRFASAYNDYRKAFWTDSIEDSPIQFIYLSSFDCPEVLSPYFVHPSSSTLSVQELYTIVNHIDECSHNRFVKAPISEIAHAGIGLTEFQFIDYCLTSIKLNKEISPKYINDQKMLSIKQRGILEIVKPTITFDQIGGLDNIKDIIARTAKLRQNPKLAADYGITPIRRVLMVGVPGTGKSAICQATSAELNLDLARTGISQVMNSYIGQSEANMRAVFQQIKAMNPVCVWIDEFGRDLSGGASSSHVDGGTTDRVHGEFLTGLQELPEESFLLCAANDITQLKPEMLRADRFDKIFFVGLPSFEERKHILNIHLSNIKTDHTYDYDALAEATAFMTGAEIVTLIKECKFYVVSDTFRPINTQDILRYAPQMKNTIWRKHPDVIKGMYEYALQQWDWASTSQMEDAKIILGKKSNASKSKVLFN